MFYGILQDRQFVINSYSDLEFEYEYYIFTFIHATITTKIFIYQVHWMFNTISCND